MKTMERIEEKAGPNLLIEAVGLAPKTVERRALYHQCVQIRPPRQAIQRLITQMYFEGDPMIWQCPIVNTIDDRKAIEQLVAALDMQNTVPMDTRAYRWDIVLRGKRSTLFENRLEGN